MLAAQLALLVHQTGDVVTHHLGAQGPHVPAEGTEGTPMGTRNASEKERLRLEKQF